MTNYLKPVVFLPMSETWRNKQGIFCILANDLQNIHFDLYCEFAEYYRATVKHYFSTVVYRSSPPNLVIKSLIYQVTTK